MARVPQYDGPQVREAALPDVRQDPRAFNEGNAFRSRVVSAFSEVAERELERDAQQQAFDGHAKLQQDWMAADADLRQKYRGASVDQYKVEAEKWWSEAPSKYAQGLNPRAQQLADRAMKQTRLQAAGSSLSYYTGEKERAADEAALTAKGTEVHWAATVGTPEAVASSREKIKGINAAVAQRKQWTADQLQQQNIADISTMHVVIVRGLMRRDKMAEADTYFQTNKAEIALPQQEALADRLEVSTSAADGDGKAEEIWRASGPKKDGDPVEVDKLHDLARKAFPDDPKRQGLAIAGINTRAQAFKSSEQERGHANLNGAVDVYSKTKSVAAMQKSPSFLALLPKDRENLLNTINDRRHMLWVRGLADQDRAESERTKRAFPLYNEYMNPAHLGAMSREGVSALRLVIGDRFTNDLLNKWDSMQTKEGKLAATMDADDFNTVAFDLGLKPYSSQAKTPDEHQRLATLHSRVEGAIDEWQRQRKTPMPREEKKKMMREEMARQVVINNRLWFDDKTPAILLNAEQLSKVEVPLKDAERIGQRLNKKWKETGDPVYEPTPDNIKQMFILEVSPRGGAAAIRDIEASRGK